MIVKDLAPLNKERWTGSACTDIQGIHEHLDQGWKDYLFALFADRRVVRFETGDLAKLPRELREPPPRDSQAGSNHSGQHRRAHDVLSVSSGPTSSTPRTCPIVSEGNETTPL